MTGLRRSRRRLLRPEEIELWRHVLRDVKPMAGAVPLPAPAIPDEMTSGSDIGAPPLRTKDRSEPPKFVPPAILPLAPIERRLRQKLSRGQRDVDAALDLHGLRQDQAHDRLRQFLQSAQSDGARLVLIVTGKGRASRPDSSIFDEVGILRRNVPHWLKAPDLRRIVLSVEEATATHGGSGALYVRLRRPDRIR